MIGDSPMSALSLLHDHEAETINGGFWNGLFYKSFSAKGVLNKLDQSNYATNMAWGGSGLSLIGNEQVNIASLTTIIGA
jgi:hypothetical protein